MIEENGKMIGRNGKMIEETGEDIEGKSEGNGKKGATGTDFCKDTKNFSNVQG